MPQRKEILIEWKSITGNNMELPAMPEFTVPTDYFNGLPDKILQIIKINTATEELQSISPFLADIPVQNPFTLPDNYFNNLSEKITAAVKNNDQEINLHSSKIPVQSVPEKYFDEFPDLIFQKIKQPESKIIPLRKNPLYRRPYLAAAIMSGIIALSSALFIHREHQNINYQLAHLSSNDIVEYLQNESDVFDRDIIYNNVDDSLQLPTMNDLSTNDIEQYLNAQPD